MGRARLIGEALFERSRFLQDGCVEPGLSRGRFHVGEKDGLAPVTGRRSAAILPSGMAGWFNSYLLYRPFPALPCSYGVSSGFSNGGRSSPIQFYRGGAP